MKAVILAGGKGTRIGEESRYKPKPMVEVGGRPILWHIMKRYGLYGVKDFVVCCGYKGHMVKDYFLDYRISHSSVRIDMKEESVEVYADEIEDWEVTLANTGLETLTAGRVLQIQKYIGEEDFFLTYGDGVGDVDIDKLMNCHRKSGRVITITVTKPEGRFGAVQLDEKTGIVHGFKEKARRDQNYVNAGFMVCSRKVFGYLGNGCEMLEDGPFERLAADGQMNAYIHEGFWSPMDSMRDRDYLDGLMSSENAPWLL